MSEQEKDWTVKNLLAFCIKSCCPNHVLLLLAAFVLFFGLHPRRILSLHFVSRPGVFGVELGVPAVPDPRQEEPDRVPSRIEDKLELIPSAPRLSEDTLPPRVLDR